MKIEYAQCIVFFFCMFTCKELFSLIFCLFDVFFTSAAVVSGTQGSVALIEMKEMA